MRVTQNSTANQVLQNLQTIETRQTTLEQYASTGVKISNPGDDPTTAQQILHLKSQSAATTQYARNITNATSILTMSDSAMASMSDTLTRTKELALSMSSGTTTEGDRGAVVQELQQLKSQMVSLGNTQMNGKFIFGGYKNDSPPFDAATGAYSGSEDNLTIAIDQSSKLAVSTSGSALMTGGTPPGKSGTDIMGMYDNLIAALNSGDSTQVQAQLGTIDNASTQVINSRAVVGASMNRLTATTSIQDDSNLATSKVLSGLQDVDYLQVVSDLSKQQVAYQTAIAASAKISQMSLLDYLK